MHISMTPVDDLISQHVKPSYNDEHNQLQRKEEDSLIPFLMIAHVSINKSHHGGVKISYFYLQTSLSYTTHFISLFEPINQEKIPKHATIHFEGFVNV